MLKIFSKLLAFAKLGVTYKYSSVQIQVPEDLSKQIISFGKKHIPDNLLVDDEEKSMGRENDSHITVLYGLYTKDVQEIKERVEKFKPFKVQLGRITKFDTKDEYDVIKIDIKSDVLHKVNKSLSELEHKQTHPTYNPHLTIAYVKKDSCNHLLKDDFSGEEFMVNELVFSSPDQDKQTIPL